jgi:hypothetical protein
VGGEDGAVRGTMDIRISEHILSVDLETVGARFMKKVNRRSILNCLAVVLITSSPLSAESTITLKNEEPAILNIYGAPIGIRSDLSSLFARGDPLPCNVYIGVFPMGSLKIEHNKSMVIKVEGEKNISILCKGEDGVVITRD